MSWLRSKLRQVAARASDALAQAADIVAPTLYESRADEFHHRWSTVARFLESVLSRDLDEAEQRRLLLDSHTRESLQKLVLLIYAEENASDRMELALARSKAYFDDSAAADGGRARSRSRAQSQTPPSPPPQEHAPRECLEYLLEKQLIPHLCEVGRRDQPCGIMSLAMQFVGALLSRVTYPILPTREVHVSVVALIQAAARKEVEDPVVRKCLINLLNILWKKLRGDPVQTEFFFLHADRLTVRTTDVADGQPLPSSSASSSNRLRTLSAGSAGSSDDPFLLHHHHQTQSDVPELILFTGLLPHMYAVGKIGEKCREALVIAAAVHDKALCRFVLQLTPFCHYAVNGVISAFDALPKTLASDAPTPASAAASTRRDSDGAMEMALNHLAVRLRFCCTLAMVARYELDELDELTGERQRRSIADELLDQFRARFLEGPMLEGLLHTSEAAARAATLYARIILEELTACGRDTRANPLLCVYLQFLLERPPTPAATPMEKTVTAIAEEDEAEEAVASTEAAAAGMGEPSAAQLLPTELLHRMDSLSSSLSIATIDLFTSVLDLQDDLADSVLLGDGLGPRLSEQTSEDQEAGSVGEGSPRKRRPTASSLASPSAHGNGAIWFASRFPDSAVASNVHLWKIRAFAGVEDVAEEIPAADDQEDQVLSLLSYIADAEYAACQRGPEDMDNFEDDESDDQAEEDPAVAPSTSSPHAKTEAGAGPSAAASTLSAAPSSPPGARGSSSRTAAVRNAMKPLREVHLSISLPSFSPAEPSGLRQRTRSLSTRGPSTGAASTTDTQDVPLFVRIVLSRAERLLENSFHENLALSGLVYALAQKPRCAAMVFDLDETRPAGQSLRSILEEVYADALRRLNRLPNGAVLLQDLRKKLVEDDNDAALNDHEAETRLLCGYVVLEEVLKELCSLLFARERVKTLPLKPEGYYLEPKRAGSSFSPTGGANRMRGLSSETLFSDDGSQTGGGSSPRKQAGSISREFEELLAEAESSMESLLVGSGDAPESDVTTSEKPQPNA